MNLEPRQIVRLRGARGVRLACGRGTLWMTQENLARDDFLTPGQSRVVETDGVVVIEALVAASLAIESAVTAQMARAPRPEARPA